MSEGQKTILKVQESRGFSAPTVIGPFHIAFESRLVIRDGTILALRGRAFDLFCLLARRSGRIVSASEIAEQIWPNRIISQTTIRTHISVVRRVLAGGSGHNMILNITGRGYTFIPPAPERPDRQPACRY